MSSTIMYQYQFVRSNSGITPVVLWGESNVTECHWTGNRWTERLARDWTVFLNLIGVSEMELTKEAKELCGRGYQEHWLANNKWVDDAGLMRWVKRGIKSAATIEEILAVNPLCSVQAYLSTWADRSYTSSRQLERHIYTTAEFDEWIAEVKKMREELGKQGVKGVYPVVEFTTEKFVKPASYSPTGKKPKIVAVKSKYGFLRGFDRDTDGRINCTRWGGPEQALKLPYEEGSEVAKEITGVYIHSKLVDTETNPYNAIVCAIPKDVEFDGTASMFVTKVTPKRICVTEHENKAKRYGNLDEAQKAARRMSERSQTHRFYGIFTVKPAVEAPLPLGVRTKLI